MKGEQRAMGVVESCIVLCYFMVPEQYPKIYMQMYTYAMDILECPYYNITHCHLSMCAHTTQVHTCTHALTGHTCSIKGVV